MEEMQAVTAINIFKKHVLILQLGVHVEAKRITAHTRLLPSRFIAEVTLEQVIID